jgi:hypothetical protein
MSVEVRATFLIYVVEEELASIFTEVKVALIISQEAVTDDEIVALMRPKRARCRGHLCCWSSPILKMA